MKKELLYTLLDMLTGAYNRRDVRNAEKGRAMETNIGRLFETFAEGLEAIRLQCDKLLLWDDIDKVEGAVLDRYGKNFGVARSGADDVFYRLLIKIKMISLLSGGDIDTVINAAASLFDVDPTLIELREIFPAKINLYLDESAVSPEQLEIADLIATVIKRIIAAGVGFRMIFRTYRDYTNTAHIYTGCAEHAEITIHPASHDRTFTDRRYISSSVFEYADITIRPAS